jgi:Uma2 family endonuclease
MIRSTAKRGHPPARDRETERQPVETIIAVGAEQVSVPAWVKDYASFIRWMHSGEFPEEGKICFINGNVWMDPSMEDFYSHNAIRAEIGRSLANLMKETDYGEFVVEGMRYGHRDTELSTEPDGMVFSHEALRDGRATLTGGESGLQSELLGSPEIVIEIVSRSSEVKDTEWAMSAYHDAGIGEYWVIDARNEDDIQFTIFKRGKKEFTAARKSAGWVKSTVLGKSFRLTRIERANGNPAFTLEYR